MLKASCLHLVGGRGDSLEPFRRDAGSSGRNRIGTVNSLYWGKQCFEVSVRIGSLLDHKRRNVPYRDQLRTTETPQNIATKPKL